MFHLFMVTGSDLVGRKKPWGENQTEWSTGQNGVGHGTKRSGSMCTWMTGEKRVFYSTKNINANKTLTSERDTP